MSGEDIFSEDDDDGYGDEEGEEDFDENGDPAFLQTMTEEQKQKLRDQGIDLEYLEGQEDDFDDDEAEYGDDDELSEEGYGDEEGSATPQAKAGGAVADDEDDVEQGGPSKRPKTQ